MTRRRATSEYLPVDDARGGAPRARSWSSGPSRRRHFRFMDDEVGGERIRSLVRETGIELLLGSDQIDRRTSRTTTPRSSSGRTGPSPACTRRCTSCRSASSCRCSSCCFSSDRSSSRCGGFHAGRGDGDAADEPRTDQHGHLLRDCLSAAWCVNRCVRGSQLLTTITNDAWYGHSSAPYQHFLQASMRAIEQGRYLARAANTGISGIVDPYGRVVQQSEIFERDHHGRRRPHARGAHDLWQNRRSVRIHLCGADAGRAALVWRHSWLSLSMI